MADGEQQVDWCLVRHTRFPIPWDAVMGRYPTELDAQNALNAVLLHAQWFTTYSVERRVKGG